MENLSRAILSLEKLILKLKFGLIKNKLKLLKDGYFVFGLDRDRKYDVVITLNKDGNKEKL